MPKTVRAGVITILAGVCFTSALNAASKPNTIDAGGISLHSVSVSLPTGDQMFAGANAEAINNNCLACHSASMVLNQPSFPKAVWQAEVDKMRKTYKAPISDADAGLIVSYLAVTKGTK